MTMSMLAQTTYETSIWSNAMKLHVAGSTLARTPWTHEMMKVLVSKFPRGYSLGLSDEDYIGEYLVDITVALLNEYNWNNGINEEWSIIGGDLFSGPFTILEDDTFPPIQGVDNEQQQD